MAKKTVPSGLKPKKAKKKKSLTQMMNSLNGRATEGGKADTLVNESRWQKRERNK